MPIGVYERTDQMKANIKKNHAKYWLGKVSPKKGKTLEEICGKERAKEIKNKIEINTKIALNNEITKDKLIKSHIGKHPTEETRKKNSESHKNKKQSKEHPKNVWKSRKKNDPNNFWTKKATKKAWETRRKNGKDKQTEEEKEKHRVAARRKCLRDGQFESIGKHEKELLDKQEIIDGIPIYRQYYVYKLGRKVDGYNPFINVVYEVYEPHHKNQIEKDLKRQKEIEECLGCKFVIIWDTCNKQGTYDATKVPDSQIRN